MKLTKKQMLMGAGVIALVGLYLVIKSFKSNSNQPMQPTPPSPPTTPPLPIVKGDRDPGSPLSPMGKVVNLQKAMNLKGYSPRLAEDGIFGPKTEAAVQSYLNKKTVDTQADLDALKK
jgi:peptidoglycan hydrolase-like protein with peptidoglycan-binding domain